MKKYLIRFTTKNGDYDKEWVYADSKQEAENNIRREHWNIKNINLITEL